MNRDTSVFSSGFSPFFLPLRRKASVSDNQPVIELLVGRIE